MFFPAFTQKRLLIDCNSFFASCEVLRDPTLRGKPVCIGKEGEIVLAATYEAKRYGVRTGTPVWEAKKMLPREAVFLPGDMRRYGMISQKLMRYLQEKFHTVLVASIDEAFIHLTYERLDVKNREMRCKDLKSGIVQDIGIPVSIGLSVTKLLAKLCSEQRKPLGEYVALTPMAVQELLRKTKLIEISFIGPATAEKLAPRCKNARELAKMAPQRVQSILGMHGMKLRYELNGISLSMKKIGGKPKSIGRVRSFNPHFTTDQQKVWLYLQANLERAWRELRDQELQTGSVHVILKAKSFRGYHARKALSQPTDLYEQLAAIVKELFDQAFVPGELRRRTGVLFYDLSPAIHKQGSLFAASHEIQQDALDQVMHMLNKKMGKGTIKRGTHAGFLSTEAYEREEWGSLD